MTAAGIISHHLASVYSAGTGIMLYVDGVLEASNIATSITGNAAPLLFGGITISGTPTALFTGWLDDAQIYGGALSAAQVQLLYENPGQTTAVPEPAAYAVVFSVLALGLSGLREHRRRRARVA